MASDIAHAVTGLVLLLGILVLNIFKPKGRTRYGWRKERAERAYAAARQTAASTGSARPAPALPIVGSTRWATDAFR